MRYVAFLRAINVGGRAVVRMADVKRAFESAGCTNVATVIQSGNVVFESAEKKAILLQKIEAGLRELIDAPVFTTRSVAALDRLRKAPPAASFRTRSDAKLCVVFLARKSPRNPRLPLADPKEAVEVVGRTDRDVFVVSRRKKNGFYGFPNQFVEKSFGVAATTRNWSTIARIVELLTKS